MMSYLSLINVPLISGVNCAVITIIDKVWRKRIFSFPFRPAPPITGNVEYKISHWFHVLDG